MNSKFQKGCIPMTLINCEMKSCKHNLESHCSLDEISIIIDWKGTCDNYEKLNDKVHHP